MELASLRRRWQNAGLPLAFFHSTFPDNVPSIISERRLTANRGVSVCRSENSVVSLSDRVTKGILEFFGGVILEFDAPSLYSKNVRIVPKDYRVGEDDVGRYDELPFFENEWIAPREVVFDLADIKKLILVTGRGFPESIFEPLLVPLEDAKISYVFLSEKWLSDKINVDIARYFSRLEKWQGFLLSCRRSTELTV